MVKGAVASEVQKILEQYNSASRVLNIALKLISVISEVGSPSDLEQYFIDEVSPIFTHQILREAYALDLINQGDIFADSSGVEVEIQEDWVFEWIDFNNGNNFIPAGLISLPLESPLDDCLVWQKVVLHYKPKLASYYPNRLPFPIETYPFALPESYPPEYKGMMPVPSGNYPVTVGIFEDGLNGYPEPHLRYSVSNLGLKFLACDGTSDNPSIKNDVYPAFVLDSDGNWRSHGINDSFYDSAEWINDQIEHTALYNRVLAWCSVFGCSATYEHSMVPLFDRIILNGNEVPGGKVRTGGGKPPISLPTIIPITEILSGKNMDNIIPKYDWIKRG